MSRGRERSKGSRERDKGAASAPAQPGARLSIRGDPRRYDPKDARSANGFSRFLGWLGGLDPRVWKNLLSGSRFLATEGTAEVA